MKLMKPNIFMAYSHVQYGDSSVWKHGWAFFALWAFPSEFRSFSCTQVLISWKSLELNISETPTLFSNLV